MSGMFQFSLKRLMLAVACFAAGMGMWQWAVHYPWSGLGRAQIATMFLACFVGGAGVGVLFAKWWVAWIASVAVTIAVIMFIA